MRPGFPILFSALFLSVHPTTLREEFRGSLSLLRHSGVPVSQVRFVYRSDVEKASLRNLALNGTLSIPSSSLSISLYCQNQTEASPRGQTLDYIVPASSSVPCLSARVARTSYGRRNILLRDEGDLSTLLEGVGTVDTGLFVLSSNGSLLVLREAYKVHPSSSRVLVNRLSEVSLTDEPLSPPRW